MTAEVLYSELVQAGVTLTRIEDGRLMVDDTAALVPFCEAIREHKDALLEIVAKRDRMFYEWINNVCFPSPRVNTSLRYLWLSYRKFCMGRSEAGGWVDFNRLIQSEFEVFRGMVEGLSLKTDLNAYIPTARLQ